MIILSQNKSLNESMNNLLMNQKNENISTEFKSKKLYYTQLMKELKESLINLGLIEKESVIRNFNKEKYQRIKKIINNLENFLIGNNIITSCSPGESLKKIIKALEENHEKIKEKNIDGELYLLINLIEDLQNEIYNNKEIENFKKESEEKYNPIGEKKLTEILKINLDIKKQIDEFKSKKTKLIFDFLLLNNNNKFYDKIKIFGEYYSTSKFNVTIEKEINDENENQTKIELSTTKMKDSNKEFIININLHQLNYYCIFIDIKSNEKGKEKSFSADINYYSDQEILLPEKINISNNELLIKNSINNMKRIVLINIYENELFNYLETFNYYRKSKTEEIIKQILKKTNLDISISIKDDENEIVLITENKEKIINEINNLGEEQKNLVNTYFEKICGNKEKIDLDKIYSNTEKVKKEFNKELMQKFNNIFEKFFHIPYYIHLRNNNIPNEDEINLVFKIGILKIIISNSRSVPDVLRQKIKFFINFKENEFKNTNDNKRKIIILINTLKYLLETKEENNFKYKLIDMKNLPEYSPYIQSEILYRKIISSLNEDSKLKFLFLQLNSGGGYEILTSKTWYKIKMIPLISIKDHILNDFLPFFFVYSSVKDENALCDPMTHAKSFNEKMLQKNNENISIHKSDSNTVKILFMKFHEYSHSKYSSYGIIEKSPQFLLKSNLYPLDNSIGISQALIKGKIKYTNKEYLKKYCILEDKQKEEYKNIEKNSSKLGQYIEDNDDEFNQNIIEKMNYGESGAAIEYYLCNNYLCSNGIISYNGNLKQLLNPELYIGKSLLDLKRIIERKIVNVTENNPNYLKKCSLRMNVFDELKKVKKKPGEMVTYFDVGKWLLP